MKLNTKVFVTMLRQRQVKLYLISFACIISFFIILSSNLNSNNESYRLLSSFSHRNIQNYDLRAKDGDNRILQPISTNPYEGSPNINLILETTRTTIKTELRNYNFASSGVHKLEDLSLETNGKPLRNIIISTWRSGSTFLGEILNAMPGNFYHYEPFWNHGIKQIRGPPDAENSVTTIKKMLKCEFNNMNKYFEYAKTDLLQFNHNTRLWDHCKFNTELCLDPYFTSKFCKLFPFQSMKVVRVRLNVIKDVLEDEELDAKLILLVRDPRGVMQSRQRRSFCKPAPDCWEPRMLCVDMISDYEAAKRLIQRNPDQIMVLRYEELALHPNKTVHEVQKFLRLGNSQSVNNFLHSHSQMNLDLTGAHSTYRISRDVPFKWRHKLDYKYVEEIQRACKEAMAIWGYEMAENETHMTSQDFYPLKSYTLKGS